MTAKRVSLSLFEKHDSENPFVNTYFHAVYWETGYLRCVDWEEDGTNTVIYPFNSFAHAVVLET